MIFILAVDHVRFGGRQHVDVARPQAEYEGSSHRGLRRGRTELDSLASRFGSGRWCSHWSEAACFLTEIRFNLIPIDVAIGQGRVDFGRADCRRTRYARRYAKDTVVWASMSCTPVTRPARG